MEAYTTLAHEIAAALGGWADQVDEGDEYYQHGTAEIWLPGTVERNAGPGLVLQFNPYRHRGRVVARGAWPLGPDGRRVQPYLNEDLCDGGWKHSITVSLAKAPQEIAKDIRRRFLPGYAVAYAEMMAKVDGMWHRRRALEASRDRIEEVFPGVLSSSSWRSDVDQQLYHNVKGGVYFTGEISGAGDEVTLHLSRLGIDEGLRVLALLREIEDARRATPALMSAA